MSDKRASFSYLAPMEERPYYYQFAPPEGTAWRNTRGDRRDMSVEDARELPGASLSGEGFQLVSHRTKVGDLWDADLVRARYYPEIEALVAEAAGAKRVVAFDHNVRSAERASRGEAGVQPPVRFVHNDYTEQSGPQRVRDLMPADQVDELLAGRFAVVNVWKPISGPVRQAPLGVLDARSIAPGDLVPTELRYRDRVGEIYSLTWSEAHRWFHYPEMEAEEALLLACYDSARGRARFTAHSAFDDPDSPVDAPPRESIEVRTLAFF